MQTHSNHGVQPPAVAGLFYPADPEKLQQDVDRFLRQAEQEIRESEAAEPRPRALIAPHAGYIYSGAVAAAAYARLLPYVDQIRRVVLLAPAHRLGFRGLAVASAEQFSTPLGRIPVDLDQRDRLLARMESLNVIDEAFTQEHALEVQLPFLQRLLTDFSILPILVGDAEPETVRTLIEQCWDGPQTLVVVSSDLSHFHDYATAEQLDRSTTEHIVAKHPERIDYGDACGRIPINGLLLMARDNGLQVQTVARCNSGDTAGDRQRVVGYGAYVFG